MDNIEPLDPMLLEPVDCPGCGCSVRVFKIKPGLYTIHCNDTEGNCIPYAEGTTRREAVTLWNNEYGQS